MKLKVSDIAIVNYKPSGNRVVITFKTSDYQEISALDGQELTVVSNEDEQVAVFGGYHLTSMEKNLEGNIKAVFIKNLDPDVKAVVDSIASDMDRRFEILETALEDLSLKVYGE